MLEIALIGGAAGLGAVTRYLFSTLNNKRHQIGFPVGTYLVNIVGTVLIGYLMGRFGNHAESYKIFATGFCGGLTTFSTFNFELFQLLEDHDYKHFSLYFLFSYGLGFVGVILGLVLAGAPFH
ncbi:MAG: fluoride efflux transporter CrcB [Streptococcaceae bacterium]|jgi:CrcB protein|nr:fluoride efflux transporter CrcB [Streptococcaceae bacterium]